MNDITLTNEYFTNAPEGMNITQYPFEPAGLVTWTPIEGVLTSGEVTVQVSDGGEDSASVASETFTITVTAVNDAPVITSSATLSATEDIQYTYQVEFEDSDDTIEMSADEF